MNNDYNQMSMIEVTEKLMNRKKKPQSFHTLATEVSEIMGLSSAELQKRVGKLYADMTLSGKFVALGNGKWDLKRRQKFEVGDYGLLIDSDDDGNYFEAFYDDFDTDHQVHDKNADKSDVPDDDSQEGFVEDDYGDGEGAEDDTEKDEDDDEGDKYAGLEIVDEDELA